MASGAPPMAEGALILLRPWPGLSRAGARGIDRRPGCPPPMRMSRMESERLGPFVLAPGSLVFAVRWSGPSTRKVVALKGGGPGAGGRAEGRRAVAGERVLGGVVDLGALDLGGDEEEDQREGQPRADRDG